MLDSFAEWLEWCFTSIEIEIYPWHKLTNFELIIDIN